MAIDWTAFSDLSLKVSTALNQSFPESNTELIDFVGNINAVIASVINMEASYLQGKALCNTRKEYEDYDSGIVMLQKWSTKLSDLMTLWYSPILDLIESDSTL